MSECMVDCKKVLSLDKLEYIEKFVTICVSVKRAFFAYYFAIVVDT